MKETTHRCNKNKNKNEQKKKKERRQKHLFSVVTSSYKTVPIKEDILGFPVNKGNTFFPIYKSSHFLNNNNNNNKNNNNTLLQRSERIRFGEL